MCVLSGGIVASISNQDILVDFNSPVEFAAINMFIGLSPKVVQLMSPISPITFIAFLPQVARREPALTLL